MIMWPAFMSVRWKLWAPFLLAVSCIHLSLYSYFGFQLEQQYERDQQAFVNSNLKALDGVLTTSYHKLLEVGQTILLMKHADPNWPDQVSYQEFVRSSIKEKYPQFEAQGILDAAAVFDAQGRLMFSVGGIDIKSNSGAQSALENEQPVREMSCDHQCLRTIAIPLLNSGEVKGVLVLGRLMQDMVLDFRQLTSVEIGFARTTIDKPSDIVVRALDFTQLTQRNRNIQILQSLSQQVEHISNDTLYRVDGFDRNYEVFFTVPKSVALTDTVWVLISDGTTRYQAVSALKNQLGFGLIVSALLLLLIAFMSAVSVTRRLINVTSFAKEQSLINTEGTAKELSGRQHINHVRKETLLFQDEIADASRWISDFSNKVDCLSESECKANQRLDDMAQALRLEKEMVAHLVGNSENIIVTQSTDGIVLTINDVGKKLFDITSGEGMPEFTDLFFAGEPNQEAVDGINRLYMGLDNLVCTDSQSLDLAGQLRYFSWIHSYISECSEHRAIILSIGMDVTEKREAERRLGWLVMQYPITEVANQAFFLEKLPEVMEVSLRDERSLAVLCCDVKRLHDSQPAPEIFGNDTELSAAVAGRISSCLREDDIVARFDDELFMVILKGIKTPDSGGSVAQQIITAFSVPFCLNDSESIVGINIGISIFPEQAVAVTDIMDCAELAMHMSRDLGVNSYQYYRLEQPSTNENSDTCVD